MTATSCLAEWKENSISVRCRLGATWLTLRKLRSEGKAKLSLSLPDVWELDQQGLCLFHSDDDDWKRQQRAGEHLKTFIKSWDTAIFRKLIDDKYISFYNCSFTGDLASELDLNDQVINLTDLKFKSSVLFADCRFKDTTWFGYSCFVRTVSFERCTFERDVDLGNTQFEQRFTFKSCVVGEELSCRDAKFGVGADFEDLIAKAISFNNSDLGDYFNLANASADKIYLKKCTSRFHDFGSMVDLSTIKARELHMEECRFPCEVSFEGMNILDGEVIDTEFPSDKLVSFSAIQVAGLLHIKSRDPKRKLFAHAVSLRITKLDDISGSIIFENANVFHLKLNENAMALRRMRPARILFGAGCDPYRLKKEIIVPCCPEWMPLISEVAGTFGTFFRLHRSDVFELKVECEYGSAAAIIRYFADADIEEDAFLQLLSETAPHFVDFLRDPDVFTRQLLARVQGPVGDTPSWKTRVFDLYRNGVSLICGMAARAQFDTHWTLEDTRSMLSTAGELPSPGTTVEFHQHIFQIALFSKAEQIAAGRDARLLQSGDKLQGEP